MDSWKGAHCTWNTSSLERREEKRFGQSKKGAIDCSRSSEDGMVRTHRCPSKEWRWLLRLRMSHSASVWSDEPVSSLWERVIGRQSVSQSLSALGVVDCWAPEQRGKASITDGLSQSLTGTRCAGRRRGS